MTYEINITQDRLIKGFEAQESELGEMVHCYSDMLAYMIHRFIYSEDIEKFAQYGSRANLSREYEEGKSESTIEYRRLMDDGRYIWVRAITNLTRSLETGDLIAVVFIKDIEVEKQYQLNLQHKAERDPLTGLYNKEMIGKLVNEALTFHPTHTKSALFMIDADNFKEVNDQLGHFYGDAVLCELAEKLQRIFRSNDIVGRIGGDEYIAFMKEGATKSVVEKKAAEICKAFYTVYKGTDHENFILSSSIGIAIFPKDGSNFDELYHKADIALYEAKSNGKNNFVLYHGNTFNGYQSNRNTILQTGFPASKSFRNNRIEYVFKILYQSDNPFVAIQSVLELVAGHFSFERGYIFETSKDGKHLSKTFEWCASDVEPQIDLLQNIPIDMLIPNYSQFCEEGVFVMRPLEDSQINHRDFLEPLGIKLMMQFGIFDKGKLIGFIGFDNCENDLIPSELEIDEMKTICNILATFFVMRRICEAAEESLATMTKIMNYFENYIYVIDPQSFEILYVNEKLKQRMGENQENLPCYCFLMGYEEQCSDCPMKKITVSSNQKETFKKYNEKFDLLMEVEFSYLRWKNGKDVCMVSCLVIPKEN